jgi:hypothetical protein
MVVFVRLAVVGASVARHRTSSAIYPMPIDVEWQDECGKRLARYDGPLIDGLPERAPENSPCLRFIDPYGNTTFNASQVEVLEIELSGLIDRNSDVSDQAASLLAFVKTVTNRTHRYLKFIGD